ncbi:hypothetical protein NNC19_03300 [Clostridium sp. SHJSY1]|uniref:hypothetical protein n=1 Tax=Clostridium sp. SHJSY1 TaxID=2942483 RepID=UPI0028761CDD|nr:hypothetical protein [Clostridium sp. SHJSY1]MDS0524691.1 hypothetical protein [Clostridium sp. SHJSY1]
MEDASLFAVTTETSQETMVINLNLGNTDSNFSTNPNINIVKYLSIDGGVTWFNSNTQPFPQVLIGDSVLYKYVVTNISESDLNNLILIDIKLDIYIPIVILEQGANFEFITSILQYSKTF